MNSSNAQSFDGIIAKSQVMLDTMVMIKKLSGTDSTILMTGETGTGKSFLSSFIHNNSKRCDKPFVTINCANISENLLESELFGHERGSFTGADRRKIGRFEVANGGTIFLDEIGELSGTLQSKLLRVLEDKEFERVGGNQTIHSDIRIVAATNRNLESKVKNGTFRQDLYYRINVLRVHIPPLRDRVECIEPLSNHILSKFSTSHRRFDRKVINRFEDYSWPGNIRELSNTIERASILDESSEIGTKHIVFFNTMTCDDGTPETLDETEYNKIMKTLEKNFYVQKDTARELGIPVRVLNYKLRKYKITHRNWRIYNGKELTEQST